MAYINGKEILFSPILSLIDGVDKNEHAKVVDEKEKLNALLTVMIQGGAGDVVIPDGITVIREYAFYRMMDITSITFPDGITTIERSAFRTCSSCLLYDFTKLSAVPVLNDASAFDTINAKGKIKVPDALYNEWSAATNWANYADYIVSDVVTTVIPAEDRTEYAGIGYAYDVGIGFYFSRDLTAGKRYISRTHSDDGTERTDVYEYAKEIYDPNTGELMFAASDRFVEDLSYDISGEYLMGTLTFYLGGTYKIYQRYIDRSGKEYTTSAYIYEVEKWL
jgi:hypothetical protein